MQIAVSDDLPTPPKVIIGSLTDAALICFRRPGALADHL